MNPSAETDAPPFERELLGSIEAVYRFALRLARDPSAAEDLVQETYLRALTHRDQYTPGTNCRAWLFTICRNVFMKGSMRSAREVSVADVELDAVPLPAADPAGTVFELADLDEAMRTSSAFPSARCGRACSAVAACFSRNWWRTRWTPA